MKPTENMRLLKFEKKIIESGERKTSEPQAASHLSTENYPFFASNNSFSNFEFSLMPHLRWLSYDRLVAGEELLEKEKMKQEGKRRSKVREYE
jgi:hypothetical protein